MRAPLRGGGGGGGGGGTGAVRFTPGEFRYNGRVAAALVPALAVVAALGGRAVMAVLTVGCMAAYIFDAMSLREGSLSVVRWRE